MGDPTSARPKGKIWLLGAATGAVLAGIGLAVYLLVPQLGGGQGPAAASPAVPPVVSAAGLAERNGIRIVHVALTGGGGLVDLRYQVLDADKAASVHGAPPEMVDERTAAVVNQLLMGHSHKGVLHAGQTYYLIFQNPGNLLERGGRVTVALGGLRLPHVLVQ